MASLAIISNIINYRTFFNIERKGELFYIVFKIIGVLISFFNIKRPYVRYRLKGSRKS